MPTNKRTIIKLRRGTASQWSSSDPQPGGEVLLLGEPGFEQDTHKLKIGDGVTGWNDLPYITPDFINIVSSGGIDDLTLEQQSNIFEGTIVLTSDGIRWVYSGSGDVLQESSYIQLADISPAWIQITSKPASLVGLADISSTAIGDFILATGDNTYQVTNFAESVDDRVSSLMVAGSGIGINYNDNSNSLTVTVSGLNSSFLSDFDEAVQDNFNTTLVAGTGININYNDGNNTLTLNTSGIPLSAIGDIDTTDLDNDEFLVYNSGTGKLEPSNGLIYNETPHRLTIDCDCPVGTAGIFMMGDQASPILRLNAYSEDFPLGEDADDSTFRHTSRIIFLNTRGTQASPSGNQVDDPIFILRGDAYNPHGTLTPGGALDNRTLRIMALVSATGTDYTGSDLVINTSTGGPTLYDNYFRFTYDGKLVINGIDIASPSGLSISNAGDNRVITSTGSGLYAESNMTFDGTTLGVSGVCDIDSIRIDGNTISSIDTDGDLILSPNGSGSIVLGDSTNVGAGAYSSVIGGLDAGARLRGEVCHSAGGIASVLGSSQHSIFIVKRITTDNTANVILTLDGNSPDSANLLVLPEYSLWTFTIQLSAYCGSSGDGASWNIRGSIKRNQSNTTAIIGSLITESWKDSSMNSTSVSVVADDTNKALEINVTGLESSGINWSAVVDVSQVIND